MRLVYNPITEFNIYVYLFLYFLLKKLSTINFQKYKKLAFQLFTKLKLSYKNR